MRNTLIDSAMYNAIFKSVKDYIQPIVISFMIGILFFESLSQENNNEVMLGIIYAVIFMISSLVSKNSYKVLSFGEKDKILYFIWAISAIVFIILGYSINTWFVVVLLFIMIYVLQNIRKPIMVEKIGDITDNDKRASVLSVESQITSLIIIFLAPLLGIIYDQFGAQFVFYLLAMISIIFFVIERIKYKQKRSFK